jgi:hypothetical protein
MTTVPGYTFRRLAPDEDFAIERALGQGVAAATLAFAYGVSIRTIYRAAARAGEPTRSVTVAGWRASFRLSDEGPIQLTQWHPTKEALDAWPD